MTIKFLSLAIAAGFALSVPTANAAVYSFTQTGFEEGAFVSGTFEASDSNADLIIRGGTLNSIQEITTFTLAFSGNSLVQAFTHSFSDLTTLNYRPAKSFFGDANPEGMASNWFGSTGFFYVGGTAVAGEQGGYVQNIDTGSWSHSENLVYVTPAAVPVPGAVWLFSSALAGFIGTARRKKS